MTTDQLLAELETMLAARRKRKMGDYKLMQGEPVAWVTADTVDGQAVNGKPRRIWWENNEGVGMPIYTAPQPAPDVAGLVGALKWLRGAINCTPENDKHQSGTWISTSHPRIRQIDELLAAHRKGGDHV